MTDELDPQSVCTRFRVSGEHTEHSRPWTAVDTTTLSSLSPWRTFRWYGVEQLVESVAGIARERSVAGQAELPGEAAGVQPDAASTIRA